MLQQVGPHFVGVRRGLVDLVDRHDHRHFGRLRVVNRLDRLRHHRVIRRNHQNNDIRHLRTARPHRRKRSVARRIEERQTLPAIGRHLIRTDVLRDTAGFACDNFGIADRIQQRCFTVVNVAHDRDDRWTGLQIFGRLRRF